MTSSEQLHDLRHMRRAIELAAQGEGFVEPNPMVGCVIARGPDVIAEGWHRRFGGPHAEVEALAAAGPQARGATMYVSLEPCCHHGKTPPCTQAILAAGVARVVVAQSDPFPQVAGQGLKELLAAGLAVETGLAEEEARDLNAPYLKLRTTGRPWMIAKWAMSLDGKMATHTGESRWISSESSRETAHRLRGRVDAVLIGSGTARRDDPLLTARPPGPRTALRVVVDSNAALASTSQLVRTARETPVLVAVASAAPAAERERLASSGCEVLLCSGSTHAERLARLLDELGKRQQTNVLVEGGSRLLGALLDAGEVDEVHAFIAPKLIGGAGAPAPCGGIGIAQMSDVLLLGKTAVDRCGEDLYFRGRVARRPSIS